MVGFFFGKIWHGGILVELFISGKKNTNLNRKIK